MHSELFLFYWEPFIGDLLRNRKANLSLGGPKSEESTYRVFAEPDVNGTDYIETVWGIGFKLAETLIWTKSNRGTEKFNRRTVPIQRSDIFAGFKIRTTGCGSGIGSESQFHRIRFINSQNFDGTHGRNYRSRISK